LKIRKGYVDVLAAGRRKNIIHGLIDLDVTELRRMLRVREAVGQDFDGAAAARFARRVADLVGSADGLSPPVRDVHAPPAP